MLGRLMRMEERIVLDGAGVVDADAQGEAPDVVGVLDVPDDAPDAFTVDSGTGTDGGPDGADTHAADPSAPLRALLIADNIVDADNIAAAALENVLTVTYDFDAATPQSILDALEAELNGRELDSIAFATHGQGAGAFALTGALSVTADSVCNNPAMRAFWEEVGSLLDADGEVHLLSCDTGAGAAGAELLASLESLTGHEVEASTDDTGNPSAGGDWLLESDGTDAAAVYFTSTIAEYDGVLAARFGPQQDIFQTLRGWSAVCAADLDGDGDPDVLAATDSQSDIFWFANDGTGSFGEQKFIDIAVGGANSICTADLDGDGDLDVLSSLFWDDKVVWYENDGAGNFGEKRIITTAAVSPQSVFAADLDGDGDLDVLSASSFVENKIAWYENDGAGSFGEQRIITTALRRASDVYAADLDGDGDLDVLSAADAAIESNIAWYANDGVGNFGEQQIITTAANGACDVYAADLDGDGDFDVLSASWSDDKIAWYENGGAGYFGPQQIITNAVDGACDVYAADLDGDGDLDVLSASSYNNGVAWYENGGAGSFGSEQIITVATSGSREVNVADLDGDGDLDVLAAGPNWAVCWYENILWVANAVPDLDVDEDAPFSFAVPANTFVDANGGMLTYSATLEDGSALPAWLSFDASTRTFSGTPTNDDVGAIAVKVTAVDGDGDTASSTFSLTVANTNDAPTIVYPFLDREVVAGINTGFTFSTDAFDDADAGDALTVTAALTDGSALPSWLTFNPATMGFGCKPVDSDVGTLSINVTADDGHGGTVSAVFDLAVLPACLHYGDYLPVASSPRVFDLGVADLDGDGDLDVVAGTEGGSIVWFENLGAETFGGPRVINQDPVVPYFSPLIDIEVADFDGDGDPDVLASSPASYFSELRGIGWFANDGSGNFGPQQTIFALPGRSQFVADLDGDGDTDVLSAYGGKVVWFANDGAGGFATPSAVYDAYSFCVVASDLDGDGDLDVLSAQSGSIAWSFNMGNGVFGTPQSISNGQAFAPVLVVRAADMDGDGDNDIVASRYADGIHSVCWYANNGTGGFGAGLVVPSASLGAYRDVVPADKDNDGDLDLLAIRTSRHSWLTNDGDGGFLAEEFLRLPFSQTVTPVDLDGDGDMDLVHTSLSRIGWCENIVLPVVAPVPDQAVVENSPFSYTIPDNVFAPSGTLVYSATLADGRALPGWLSFNSASRTFSGTPSSADLGMIALKIIAFDSNSDVGTDIFRLTIAPALPLAGTVVYDPGLNIDQITMSANGLGGLYTNETAGEAFGGDDLSAGIYGGLSETGGPLNAFSLPFWAGEGRFEAGSEFVSEWQADGVGLPIDHPWRAAAEEGHLMELSAAIGPDVGGLLGRFVAGVPGLDGEAHFGLIQDPYGIFRLEGDRLMLIDGMNLDPLQEYLITIRITDGSGRYVDQVIRIGSPVADPALAD